MGRSDSGETILIFSSFVDPREYEQATVGQVIVYTQIDCPGPLDLNVLIGNQPELGSILNVWPPIDVYKLSPRIPKPNSSPWPEPQPRRYRRRR